MRDDDQAEFYQTVQQWEQYMNINDAFPSKYLKADDLKGRAVKVVIDRVEMNDEFAKPVLFFRGKDKGVVLNKTNAMTIAADYGPDTSKWVGQEMELFAQKTQFEGRLVDALRVRTVPKVAQAATEFDDKIPF